MQDWSVPLTLSTGAFLAWLVWTVRPAIGWRRRRRFSRDALKEVRARIQAATDPAVKALALCEAADMMAKSIGGAARARGLYLRALRSDPTSPEIVRRAAAGLASRPRTLEALLWRHLASNPWVDSTGGTDHARAAARASLDALRSLYEGPLRNATRARALANAHDALRGAPERAF
jgi:hypothetical protein